MLFLTCGGSQTLFLCAKMRRGALHAALADRGIRKVALGHHFDDAVRLFFCPYFMKGGFPASSRSLSGPYAITQIRPMLYCGEGMIRAAAARMTCGRSQPCQQTAAPGVRR
jgi:tRNA(Ile)-lysidine synthase TilS/MesJ